MRNSPASLLELAARSIKLHNIEVKDGDVPNTLTNYLDSAHHCVNPRCKGKINNQYYSPIHIIQLTKQENSKMKLTKCR